MLRIILSIHTGRCMLNAKHGPRDYVDNINMFVREWIQRWLIIHYHWCYVLWYFEVNDACQCILLLRYNCKYSYQRYCDDHFVGNALFESNAWSVFNNDLPNDTCNMCYIEPCKTVSTLSYWSISGTEYCIAINCFDSNTASIFTVLS